MLRGPQGTLYGRNSPVGDVNVTTRAPTQDTEGMISAEMGNYDERKVMGYFGGGITDLAAASRSTRTHIPRYIKNLFNGQMVNDADNYGGRARLRWTPDAQTTVDFIAYHDYQQEHGIDSTQVAPLRRRRNHAPDRNLHAVLLYRAASCPRPAQRAERVMEPTIS